MTLVALGKLHVNTASLQLLGQPVAAGRAAVGIGPAHDQNPPTGRSRSRRGVLQAGGPGVVELATHPLPQRFRIPLR